MGLDPHKVKVISIMPCIAKKEEAALEPLRDACGDPDVDIVLTTREFVRMLRSDHILVDTLYAPHQITGFEYQVQACMDAINAGKVETDFMPHSESLRVMEIMDGLRREWGIVFPND